jgi:adenylosuccinate lyase
MRSLRVTDIHDRYTDPLVERYASPDMIRLFSPRKKHATWRRMWIALAEVQRSLGLDISQAQIEELRATAADIDFAAAERHERALRHDVMAHVHAWRDKSPAGGRIIHLGATSCDVTDNTDLLIMREALGLVGARLRAVIRRLASFARARAEQPTLGFTHFQPAQFTTVGKRAALWLQDFVLDHAELEAAISSVRFRGAKGATGTQDSFMKLFGGDAAKVEELDRRFAEKMGFDRRYAVTGQTYSRKVDSRVLNVLSEIAQSAHKMSNDLRLLCHLREIEEPFEDQQIGSSAMPYKRNPMRSERIASLSRFAISLAENGAYTAATQWFERTLDDSANRRLAIPQAFLAVDAVLVLCANVTKGLVVRDGIIARNVAENLPYIASEEIMMLAASKGGDRQELHEIIRRHAIAASEQCKSQGLPNDLLDRLAADPAFGLDRAELDSLLDPRRFTGRAAEQVERFIAHEVEPILAAHDGGPEIDEVKV